MFCYKCGKPLPTDSHFCPACGTPVSIGDDSNSNAGLNLYALTIDRSSQAFLFNSPIKVTIDESIHLNVANGAAATVQLTAGLHCLLFKCSFRSSRINVDLNRDTRIELGWDRITGKIIANML